MEIIFPWEHEKEVERSAEDGNTGDRGAVEATDASDIESLASEIAADSDRSAAEVATSIRTLADATGTPPSGIAAALLDDAGSSPPPLGALLPADREE